MTILKYFLAILLVFFSIEILVGQDDIYIRDSIKAREIAREGLTLAEEGKLEKAIEHYDKSFEIGQRLSNQIIMFLALEKKATVYKEMGRYDCYL
jgi:tetratricopeptide (TPR) repeat protein